MAGIDKLREFLSGKIGKIVDNAQIVAAAGINSAPRRLRELRDEEGWVIHSHNDDKSLKQEQYFIKSKPSGKKPIVFSRKISRGLRAKILDRNGSICQECGVAAGEPDDYGKPARLHIGHVADKSFGGEDEEDNLRVMCSVCNQGMRNRAQPPKALIWLKAQVRNAKESDQREILKYLQHKFGKQRHD